MPIRSPDIDQAKGDWFYGDSAMSAALRLSSYGLTLTQARVYLFLLINGPSTVRYISARTGMHRVDVYRKLRELEEQGLLDIYLESPKKYSAIKEKDAVALLVRKRKEKLQSLEEQSSELVSEINSLASSVVNRAVARHEEDFQGNYKLISGRRRYYSVLKGIIRQAQREIVRIIPPGGVMRIFLSGVAKEFADASERGVKVRTIIELTEQSRPYAKRLSTIVNLRQMKGIHMRFTVVDQKLAILSANPDDPSKRLDAPDIFLVLEDVRLAGAFRSLFEQLWRIAKPA